MTSTKPILYGAPYSVYVRAVRLAFAEKGIDYDLVPVDIFAQEGVPPEHLKRHPFGRIPAFQHGDVALYESSAILQYVDEVFEGPALQPKAPADRAHMSQVISVLNNYVYKTLVWGLFVPGVQLPNIGFDADRDKINAVLPQAKTCVAALNDLVTDRGWLGTPALSLADLLAAPMLSLFMVTPQSKSMMLDNVALNAWWKQICERPSLQATRPEFDPPLPERPH